MSNFETHPKSLKDELLNLVHTKEMALPDFQRDFVWQPGQTKALIVSLARRFPAGSLLRIESNGQLFAPRAIASAPDLDGHKPKYLILDGQQRLTSLYQALYGTGEHLYYVRLQKLIEGTDIDEAMFFERRARGEARYGGYLDQGRLRVLPLSTIFGGEGFHSWLDEIEEALEGDEKQANLSGSERKVFRQAYEQYVEPIATYEFPVVTLDANTSLEAVCTIFETLNSTGVKLSVFDLLSARYYAKGENLRKMWADALDGTKQLAYFGIDPYYVLQTISSQVNNSIKRSDVLNLDSHIVAEKWDDAVWGMDQTLEMLYHECGVLKPGLLSYNTVLVPLASIFMKYRSAKGPQVGALRSKLKRWYWCSVFGQAYESNPTSQSVKDIGELDVWIGGGERPETVREFVFDPESLLTTTTRQRAVYRGVLCLVLRRPPLDFHSGKKLTSGLIEEHQVDDHHVFPNGYLADTTKLSQREIDAIVNRTLIDRTTNQIIGKNAPSKYLKDVEDANGAKELEAILVSHYLPSGPMSSLRQDDFEAFRSERTAILAKLIIEATSDTFSL